MTVRLTEGGGAMIAVPGITDCLPRAFRQSSRQVKWRFGWGCLQLAMFIQRRQIHSSAGCAVVLPRYYHACGGTKTLIHRRDPFDDPRASSRLRSDSTCSCQCIGTVAAVCTALGSYHPPDGSPVAGQSCMAAGGVGRC